MNSAGLRACPICGAVGRRVLHRQSFYGGPMGEGYSVVICNECGAGFADGIPEQSEIERYYAEQSKYTYEHQKGVESPWDLARFEATFAEVAPHLNSLDAEILDIGCATGGLLSVFKRKGFPRLLGVDPSPRCATAARRLYGIEVRAAVVTEMRQWRERFDLVLMVGVLEHLVDVNDALQTAKQLLTPNGLIYCAVPDVQGLAGCWNAPYSQFSVEHINFFSIKSLSRLLAQCGFECIAEKRWTVEWREGVVEPIVSGVYKVGKNQLLARDDISETALEKYLTDSALSELRIKETIDRLWRSQEPFLVWGVGSFTRHLLATTNLVRLNIVAFVDSNPNIRGDVMPGIPVLAPDEVEGRSERILICSVAFEREIEEMVRGRLGLKNAMLSVSGRTSDR